MFHLHRPMLAHRHKAVPKKVTEYDIARLAHVTHCKFKSGYVGSEEERKFCEKWNLKTVSQMKGTEKPGLHV